MPFFPGHQYLGPGNPLRNGDPGDEDDGIAKSHDEAYEQTTSHEDVFAADQAPAVLLNDFRRTGNWHSALGAVGLGTKNIVEQYVLARSLYGLPGVRRKRAHKGQSDTPDAKRYQPDQAPATPKCRCRRNRTLPSVQPEQELEVSVKILQNSLSRFREYLATTEWSQCSVTAKYSPHGPMQC
ncbi:hypothetical protein HPB51_012884 [Rhipicephalus microplus]|uniref:Phospholipase A2-like domain-containing protein n=1 Tax=Rhipicephalus microplus TaxID=6941 RepID=A0A9J6DUV3_RHIMP|nr:hypothetical protein HPB51_012884 [Rhipicephalus microplus]